jgi:soluble lytic murein transglycosylase-like protein
MRIAYNFWFQLYSLIVSKLYALAKHIVPMILVIFLTLCGNSTSSLASNEQDIFYNKKYVASLITRAEKRYHIPPGLLAAIANTESGMRAYALNIGGREVNAESVFEAKEIIQKHIDSGV